MIVGFRHRGLKRLFERDDASGIRPDLLDKVRTILAQLNEAQTIEDMRMTSFHLHPLKGDMKGLWSVTVRANWRIVFSFADGDAADIELIDYH
jgi:proteic killer suppression protein